MKIKATWTRTKIYEPKSEWYPDGCGFKEMYEIDRRNATEDPDMFFENADDDIITFEIVE